MLGTGMGGLKTLNPGTLCMPGAGMEPKTGFGVVERAQVHMSKEMSLADLVRDSQTSARVHDDFLF